MVVWMGVVRGRIWVGWIVVFWWDLGGSLEREIVLRIGEAKRRYGSGKQSLQANSHLPQTANLGPIIH